MSTSQYERGSATIRVLEWEHKLRIAARIANSKTASLAKKLAAQQDIPGIKEKLAEARADLAALPKPIRSPS